MPAPTREQVRRVAERMARETGATATHHYSRRDLSEQQVAALQWFANQDGPALAGCNGRTLMALRRMGLIEGRPPHGNIITDAGRALFPRTSAESQSYIDGEG